MKKQLSVIKFAFFLLAFGALLLAGAQAQKKKTVTPAAPKTSSEIVSVVTDISAAARKSCKKIPTIDDMDGSEFNLMCGGTGGYNFYFWIDGNTNKPTDVGYVRNAKVPNFYPMLAIGTTYIEPEDDDEAPNERNTSEATKFGGSNEYKSKVGDKIEWFTRGGKVVAYAFRVYYFKDADNTLTVLDPKKADAEFVFVRGVDKYESLEHDVNVRTEGANAEAKARALVKEYFASQK